ncbi:hypothetical protein GCM10027088_55180 [Nocardia goodfellowii]
MLCLAPPHPRVGGAWCFKVGRLGSLPIRGGDAREASRRSNPEALQALAEATAVIRAMWKPGAKAEVPGDFHAVL